MPKRRIERGHIATERGCPTGQAGLGESSTNRDALDRDCLVAACVGIPRRSHKAWSRRATAELLFAPGSADDDAFTVNADGKAAIGEQLIVQYASDEAGRQYHAKDVG